MKKIQLKVKGMTCSSCEVILERSLSKVDGVQQVHVSQAKGEADIECYDGVKLEDLQSVVKDKGYTLHHKDPIENPPETRWVLRNKKRFGEIGAVFLLIAGLYVLLSQFDVIPKNLGVTDNMSYGFVFVIGLVAAMSTCLAVAGGLLLAVAEKFNQNNKHLTGWQRFQPHIYFNTGRIISYTLLGGAIGLLGSALTISPKVTGILMIGASALMIIMGFQLLQIFPWLNKLQIKMPKFIAHWLFETSQEEEHSDSKTSSFLFGGATFFLPCGFTQALQLYVLGKGSFLIGAGTMLAFSLGTLPSLAGIGAVSSFAKGNVKRHFTTFAAVLVIILGVLNVPNGLALAGTGFTPSAIGDTELIAPGVDVPSANQGPQIIQLEVRGLDYYPSTFTVKKGLPVEWHINGKNAQGCAQIFSVPALNIMERLPRDIIKKITFTPEFAGSISFSCSMGMAGPGTLQVV
jgi:uncharacterized protein